MFLHCKRSPAQWDASCPSSEPSLIELHLSWVVDPRDGQSTPGGVTQEQCREEEWPSSACWLLLFWYSPGCGWPSRLWAHGVDSCTAFHPWESPSLSWHVCSEWVLLPVCIYVWDCHNPGTTPATWTCLTSWGSHGPTFVCPHVPGWNPVLQDVNFTTHFHVICTQSHFVIDKDIKEYQSPQRHLRDDSCHVPQPECRAIGCNSLDESIQPVVYPLKSPPLKSTSLQFVV